MKTKKLKTGIMMMLIGIAIIGITVSSVSAYTFTATCTHDDYGTRGYTSQSGDGESYFTCSMTYQGYNSLWNWEKDSNRASPDYGSFYGGTSSKITDGYAYNSGAIDTYKYSSCDGGTASYSFSGRDQWDEFGAWTGCA